MSSNPSNKQMLHKWHTESIVKLKTKIRNNLLIRAEKLIQLINHEIRMVFKDRENYYFYRTIYGMIPELNCCQQLMKTALNSLYQHIETEFKINSINEKKINSFNSYWIFINNYWNNYKSEWIGNYFLYPFIKDKLFNHIEFITRGFISIRSSKINNQRNEYEQNATKELLFFICLKKIIFADIHFSHETNQSESLILDKSYISSDYLSQLFSYLGEQHYLKWNISPNIKPKEIRDITKTWIYSIVQIKKNNYNLIVMHKDNNNDKNMKEIKSVPILNNYNPKIVNLLRPPSLWISNNNNNNTDDLDIESVNSGDSIDMVYDFSNIELITMLLTVIKGNGNTQNINQNLSGIITNINPINNVSMYE